MKKGNRKRKPVPGTGHVGAYVYGREKEFLSQQRKLYSKSRDRKQKEDDVVSNVKPSNQKEK